MAIKVQFTTPEQQPTFAMAYLEWVHVDFMAKTLRGYIAFADSNRVKLKSIEVTLELTDNQLHNFGTTVLNKLINQGALAAGAVQVE